MKRYLLFYGEVYYPNGGIDDLLSEHETLEEALLAFDQKIESEMQNGYYRNKKLLMDDRWAHVYDTVECKIVFRHQYE